jgi:radical SAM superfamily enzyme YgiQ (UPF0313 family)
MADVEIVLATVIARYSHAAFGIRWLWANLGTLRERCVLREFNLNQSALEIAEQLVALKPRIIGLSVHIWNVALLTQVAEIIKVVRPEIVVVIGGPEVSYEFEDTPIFAAADYLIRGEGELAFARLARDTLDGRASQEKVITAAPPALEDLVPPYDAYTDEDLAQRLTYVEASRGCPFRCEFCLSSLEPRVREFPLGPFLEAMERLIERGARRFKFVDRTFNLRAERVDAILDFFLGHRRDGMSVHFEIVPDRLTDHMLRRIAEFPPSGLHLEVGVQSLNEASLAAIGRRQDTEKTLANIRFLCEETDALVHADLVVGLPEETWQTLASGFDRLVALRPHELQVGVLKRLKGTSIGRHPIVFAKQPPYEILQNEHLDFEQVQRLKRFARYFDLYYNSGNFPESLAFLWRARDSAFDAFMAFSDGLWSATGRTHEFPLSQLARHLYSFLAEARVGEPREIADTIRRDYHRVSGRKERLELVP